MIQARMNETGEIVTGAEAIRAIAQLRATYIPSVEYRREVLPVAPKAGE
jgi:hypothetical protein